MRERFGAAHQKFKPANIRCPCPRLLRARQAAWEGTGRDKVTQSKKNRDLPALSSELWERIIQRKMAANRAKTTNGARSRTARGKEKREKRKESKRTELAGPGLWDMEMGAVNSLTEHIFMRTKGGRTKRGEKKK